ncbi:MAG: response regulator [Deltaproteobacteria bacterium]|nr:response regulator [Deltaproteobacteria bacterium]
MSDSYIHKPKLIVYADQNADDRALVAQGFAKVCPAVTLYGVSNGKELLEYLLRTSTAHDKERAILPDAILLELNLPIKSGLEALAEIKSNRDLCHIPVVIFSTSSSDTDMRNAFRLGASSYVRKPRSFRQLIQTILTISEYWSNLKGADSHSLDKAS